MQKLAVFFLALVLLACAEQKCKVNKDCSPGYKCDGGSCTVNMECPRIFPVKVKAGCKTISVADDNNCAMIKIVC
ncbi:hypothetical protein RB195_020242 [Necator americanus]|uniref:Uncharacterized protein n=2 Tax=Necator americanus TaxID=51031 RepID=A0ABR1CHW8_NECAM|nr:hypothetical protein NECAME_14694 [Necator americanus]ETN70547.1 hypothetical protein NECAME_14694 [Necator americanus]